MIFENRRQAGADLAEALRPVVAASETAVVLGIPRGGVIVAAAVAALLEAPLDVVVPRKLRAPQNPELGIGAVADGVEVIDSSLVRTLGVTPKYLYAEIAEQQGEVLRRTKIYRGDRTSAVDLSGRVAVVVDDGIATGGTARAAVRWARSQGASRVVLAAPVAPSSIRGLLESEADQLVLLYEPADFVAVGRWYRDFDQSSDDDVIQALSGGSVKTV